jgi:hypothetical protein
LSPTEPMTNSPNERTLLEALTRLRGEQLSSVQFVQDYEQLRFDGQTLTAYSPIVVTDQVKRLTRDMPGYRDALCNRIGRTVVDMSLTAMSLAIRFDDDSVLEIGVGDVDRRGPEALEFRTADGWWVA